MQFTKLTLAAAVAALIASPAAAANVDISGLTNSDLQTYTNGTSYPVGGNTVTINGVNFLLTTLGGNAGTTGVIQTPYDYSNSSVTIDVYQANVGTVYTLINSAFGLNPVQNGELVFHDSAGDSYTYNLVEGTNVRDHYDGSYINTVTNVYGTVTYPAPTGSPFTGDVRFDAQQIVLPAGFDSSTLTTIDFVGLATGGANGAPFLAAITTASAPSPTPGAGLAGVAAVLAWLAFAKRQKRA